MKTTKKAKGRAIGGHARAATLSKEERSGIAKKAADTRWANTVPGIFAPIRQPKCALCHRAHASHERETRSCPAINGEGFDLLDRYISPHLVPKTKAALVRAYASALESIADLQGEKMNWRTWKTDPPRPGSRAVMHRFDYGLDDRAGVVTEDGQGLKLGDMVVPATPGAVWYQLPEHPRK